MDDAVRARTAAREALSDVEPGRLRGTLDDRLADATMTPGALVLVSARALDPDVDPAGVAERAAGVQLIYEGLRLTRHLAQTEPWTAADGAVPERDVPADLEILAADVLVSRGFYLLARTEAAEKAVETVRAFGRDQTARRAAAEGERRALDRNLEADVFALAALAGTTAVGGDAPPALLAYAADLARDADDGDAGDLPPPAAAFPEGAGERIAALADERVPPTTDG